MIRRNIAGQVYSGAISLFFLAMLFPLVRVFDFTSDWADGPVLSDTAYLWLFLCALLMTLTVMALTIHGQFFSKEKGYLAISYLSIFTIWAMIIAMYLNLFFDRLLSVDVAFGPRQQVVFFSCAVILAIATVVYTTARFPQTKDMEYLEKYIDRQIDQAVNKPDTTCGQCGYGIKEDWTFCPSCGGAILTEESLLAIPMEEEVLEEEEDIPERKPSFFKRTIFKRQDGKPKEKMVLEEEKKKDDGAAASEGEFIEDFKRTDLANAPPKRVKCEKCSTLLEIKNTTRPLNIRCPSCKYIWLLEE